MGHSWVDWQETHKQSTLYTQPPPKHQPQPLSPKPVSRMQVLSHSTASRVLCTDPCLGVQDPGLSHT